MVSETPGSPIHQIRLFSKKSAFPLKKFSSRRKALFLFIDKSHFVTKNVTCYIKFESAVLFWLICYFILCDKYAFMFSA